MVSGVRADPAGAAAGRRCAAADEPIRNRMMLALAYDAALRREELCLLGTEGVDPGRRMLRIKAENTKNRLERVVPYSAATGVLLGMTCQAIAGLLASTAPPSASPPATPPPCSPARAPPSPPPAPHPHPA